MTDAKAVQRIAGILENLSREVDALAEAGSGIPAVERNAVRLRGALQTLEIQFVDLNALASAPNS